MEAVNRREVRREERWDKGREVSSLVLGLLTLEEDEEEEWPCEWSRGGRR